MKPYTRPLIILFVGLGLVAWILKGFANYIDWGYSNEYTSNSIQESKNSRKFIKEFLANPPTFQIEGKSYHFKEIWLEHQTRHDYILFLFKRVTTLKEFHLCFTLDEIGIPQNYNFGRDGDNYGFSVVGGEKYVDLIDPSNYATSFKINVNRIGKNVFDLTKVAEIEFS